MNLKNYLTTSVFTAIAGVALAQPCNLNVVATANTPVCIGKNLQLSTGVFSGATYSWSGPGFSSGIRNPLLPNVNLLASGDYILTITVGACTYDDTITVTVSDKPAMPVLALGRPACKDDSLLITASTSSPGPNTFLYWKPSGGLLTPPIANASSLNNGTYKTVAINSNGCVSDTGVLNITVHDRPSLPSITLNKPACTGDTLLLGAHASGSVTGFTIWDPMGNIVNKPVGNIGTANNGTYKVVSTNASGCKSDTGTLSVWVNPSVIPGVAIYANDVAGPFAKITYVSNVSGAGVNPTYTWMKNGSAIPNATGTTYMAVNGVDVKAGDMITLSVKADATPCAGTGISNGISVATNLSVNDMDGENNVLVYPNPTSGIIHINMYLAAAYNVEIVNAIGSVVYAANGKGNMTIDLIGRIASGTYLVRMTTNGHTINKKVNILQ